MLTLSRKSI